MLIEVGLMFGVYIGVKCYKKITKTIKRAPESLNYQKPRGEGDPPGAPRDPPKTGTPGEEAGDLVKLNGHCAKVSLASMGLFGLAKFIPVLKPLGLASYIYSAIPYIKDVEDNLVKEGKVNVDVLFFMADALALAAGYYMTAGFGLFLRFSMKTGVETVKGHSRKIIAAVINPLPRTVWMSIDGVEVEVPLDQVKANDAIIVGSGAVIPMDGLVAEGMATVDQHALTGESRPAEKKSGDPVYANTFVLSGRIHIRVEKSGGDPAASQIARIVAAP